MYDNTKIYRGKRMDNMEWVKGFLFVSNTKYFILPLNEIHYFFDFIKRGEHVFGSFIEVFPETGGESAGLVVTNEEVFEGDLRQFGDYILEVFWNVECFQWQTKKVDSNYVTLYHRCPYHYNKDWTAIDLGEIAAEPILTGQMTTKIIGNVWDNSDILDKYKSKNVSQEFYF